MAIQPDVAATEEAAPKRFSSRTCRGAPPALSHSLALPSSPAVSRRSGPAMHNAITRPCPALNRRRTSPSARSEATTSPSNPAVHSTSPSKTILWIQFECSRSLRWGVPVARSAMMTVPSSRPTANRLRPGSTSTQRKSQALLGGRGCRRGRRCNRWRQQLPIGSEPRLQPDGAEAAGLGLVGGAALSRGEGSRRHRVAAFRHDFRTSSSARMAHARSSRACARRASFSVAVSAGQRAANRSEWSANWPGQMRRDGLLPPKASSGGVSGSSAKSNSLARPHFAH